MTHSYYLEGYLDALKFSMEMLELAGQPPEAVKLIEKIYIEQSKLKETK